MVAVRDDFGHCNQATDSSAPLVNWVRFYNLHCAGARWPERCAVMFGRVVHQDKIPPWAVTAIGVYGLSGCRSAANIFGDEVTKGPLVRSRARFPIQHQCWRIENRERSAEPVRDDGTASRQRWRGCALLVRVAQI